MSANHLLFGAIAPVLVALVVATFVAAMGTAPESRGRNVLAAVIIDSRWCCSSSGGCEGDVADPRASAEPAQVPEVDPLVVGVDVEAVAAQESDQRHAQPIRGLD